MSLQISAKMAKYTFIEGYKGGNLLYLEEKSICSFGRVGTMESKFLFVINPFWLRATRRKRLRNQIAPHELSLLQTEFAQEIKLVILIMKTMKFIFMI